MMTDKEVHDALLRYRDLVRDQQEFIVTLQKQLNVLMVFVKSLESTLDDKLESLSIATDEEIRELLRELTDKLNRHS